MTMPVVALVGRSKGKVDVIYRLTSPRDAAADFSDFDDFAGHVAGYDFIAIDTADWWHGSRRAEEKFMNSRR